MKLFPGFAAAIFLSMTAAPANAAIVDVTANGQFFTGALANESFTVNFSYDSLAAPTFAVGDYTYYLMGGDFTVTAGAFSQTYSGLLPLALSNDSNGADEFRVGGSYGVPYSLVLQDSTIAALVTASVLPTAFVPTSGTFSLEGPDGIPLGIGLIAGTTFTSVAAIPEPATWAMMLIGVGAAGAMMRRQRRSVRITARYA